MIKYFFAVLCLPALNLAQTNILNTMKENPCYEVELLEDSTVRIKDTQGNNLYFKNIKEYNDTDNLVEPNLIIYLDTVDFSGYENLYRIWSEPLPIINAYYGRIISIDANKNGRNEFYGWDYNGEFPNRYPVGLIYERQPDSSYDFIYQYPDTLLTAYDAGDITGDGLIDLVYNTNNHLHFFKQENQYSYVNTPNFIYNPFPYQYQPNNVTFYDIDNDGNLEIIYYLDAGLDTSVWAYSNHVAKYNPSINNYELIYSHKPKPDFFTNGISVGDFDNDGKGNFGTGSLYGKFYIYEFVEGTEYTVEFTNMLQTYNAFLTVFTDDMDSNGKPEIWIGGDFTSSTYGGVTRLFAYESSSPGLYEQVYQIDIRGLFSAIHGRMRYADMDGDGNKDLYLTNGSLSFVFKYDGSGNYYMDFVIDAPTWDSLYTIQDLLRIDTGDMDGDGISEIIPQYFIGKKNYPETWLHRSLILKRNNVVSVKNDYNTLPSEYFLSQNYPNPFNPSTTIKYSLPEEGRITIIIYDILGREVSRLIDGEKPAGEYEATWNASSYPSGVYFYQLRATPEGGQAGSFIDTKKMILMK